jgi:hypothetical protein
MGGSELVESAVKCASGGDQLLGWLDLNFGPKSDIECLKNSACAFESDSKVFIALIA